MAEDPVPISTLRARSDFVRLRRGRRVHRPAFLMQVLPDDGASPQASARFGITVTKKIGNAVCRNRIKRRFRAAIREVAPAAARAGHAYVLLARPGAATYPWAALLDDLRSALLDARAEGRGGQAASGDPGGAGATGGHGPPRRPDPETGP